MCLDETQTFDSTRFILTDIKRSTSDCSMITLTNPMEQNHVWEFDIRSVDHKIPRLIQTSRSLSSVEQPAVGTHPEAEGSRTGSEGRDGEKLYSFSKLHARWIGWLTPLLVALPPGRTPGTHCTEGWGWPWGNFVRAIAFFSSASNKILTEAFVRLGCYAM